ncbi:hypothetical protein SEVIR_1G036000v4 [Setaria viridis]|uniref:Uncharacterized protein n=1 Tax=Setaria viridis TaxID=4556 RepID=A0A4U6W6N0_SETVI|nr:uncharacterized protein LOC117849811 [Setaria viridis]TKW37254.1 hypothetical protein SEVIR_1G036000v2 [Setaria viridis]
MGQQQARPAVEDHAADALLPHQHHRDRQQGGLPGDAAAGGGSFPWLTVAGFGFLTFNSGMAVYRSQGDRGAVAFVAFSYLDLLALFYCLRRYEGAEPGSALRDRLKVAVWLLTTALTILFSYKVAAVMPVAAAVVVWLMAFATVAGGFYGFFCHEDKK